MIPTDLLCCLQVLFFRHLGHSWRHTLRALSQHLLLLHCLLETSSHDLTNNKSKSTKISAKPSSQSVVYYTQMDATGAVLRSVHTKIFVNRHFLPILLPVELKAENWKHFISVSMTFLWVWMIELQYTPDIKPIVKCFACIMILFDDKIYQKSSHTSWSY